MNGIKKVCDKHYYFFLFSAFILIYNFVVTTGLEPWRVNDQTYLYYYVDYSMGFCSKFLIGDIYNFLFNEVTVAKVSLFCIVVFTIAILLLSALLEKLMLKTNARDKKEVLFLLLFFVTGVSVITLCFYRIGSYDSYWIFLAILSLVFLSSKWLYILIIPATLLSVLVNYGSIVCYIPFIILLMIYKTTVIKNKQEKIYLWFVALFSAFSAILLFLYFLMFEQSNLTYTFEEFYKIFIDRGFQGEPVYFGTSLYGIDYFDKIDFEYINSIESPFRRALTMVFHRIKFALFNRDIEKGILSFLFVLPIVILITCYFKKRIEEKTESKIKRFSFLCMLIIFPFVIISGVLLSTDTVRFIGHAYSILFSCFLYVLYNDDNYSLELIKGYISAVPKSVTFFYCLFYMFVIFDPMG